MFQFLITRPLGFIIEWIYSFVQNYGLAIILFTILIKMILLPLNIKSQKAMRKQQKIQPIIQELQKKYENDKEKLQRETMKIYKENNVSMMGGCLPMLIQMPILIGLYQVIQRPITYLAGVTEWTQDKLDIVTEIRDHALAKFPDAVGKLAQTDVATLVKQSQIQISNWCALLKEHLEWAFNFNFLGLDLSKTPSMAMSKIIANDFSDMSTILVLSIPVVAILCTIANTKISQMQSGTAKKKDSNDSSAQMMGSMNIMMPVMTGFCTYTLPSGMGVYWIVSSLVQIIQTVALNYYFNKKGEDVDVKLPEKNRKKGKKH